MEASVETSLWVWVHVTRESAVFLFHRNNEITLEVRLEGQ